MGGDALRADTDGLRAVAVIPVGMFHTGTPLVKEWEPTAKFCRRQFWEPRL
jgi:peptidoglycan/LPS O-acetylase OafA/YrhL